MKRACVAAMLVASVAIVPMSPVADAVSLRWVDQLDGIYVEATAIDASGNVYVVGTKHRATQYRSHFAYLAK